MTYRILTSFCLLLSILTPGRAAVAESLRGTVTDSSGAVIQGATVRLLAAGRSLSETKTGSQGEFTLSPPTGAGPEEDYTLQAAASGFSPASQAIRLDIQNGVPVAFKLEVAPYRQSVEVQTSIPVSDSLLDVTGVRESAAKDLGEALTALDGVWKIRKAGIANDIVVRGFQQNNINVLVDGSRTFGACPSHMDPPTQHVDFAEVDRVEVSKGAFDVTNQGSLGAVVNIITRTPGLGFTLKPSLSAGSFGFYNPSITASYGNRVFRVLGGYSFRTSDPYKDGSGKRFTAYASYSDAGRQQKSFDINTGWLETQISLSNRQQLSLGYTRQQAGLILYPYLSMDSDHDNADRVTFRYSVRDLSSTLRSIRIEGYFTQVNHFMSDSQRTTAKMGSGGMSSWAMASDAATEGVGGRVEADWGRDFTFGVESYRRNWNMLGYMKMGTATTVNPSIPDVDTVTAGSFVSFRHTLAERWKVSAGLRFDHARMEVQSAQASTNLYYQFHNTRTTANTDNYASGNLRLGVALPKSTELFLGAGTTGRIPDAEERYISRGKAAIVTVGNPLLPVTRNTEVTAGWGVNRERFYLRPTVFYSFLDHFIIVNNQRQMNAMMTGGTMPGMGSGAAPAARSYAGVEARIYGGETTYGLTLTKSLTLSGGGSYSRGLAARQTSLNIASANLPEMPPLRGWSALRFAHTWMFAELGAVAANRQSLVDRDLAESPTPGYSIMNLKLGFTHRKFAGSFTVDNLLNRFYYEHFSYYRDPFNSGVKVPEPGRNFFAQLRYSF